MLVTSTVWEDVSRKPGVDEAPRLSSAADSGLIRVVADPETIPESLLRTTIDAGERGVIALGIELNASLLIDDRRAVFHTRVGLNRRTPLPHPMPPFTTSSVSLVREIVR